MIFNNIKRIADEKGIPISKLETTCGMSKGSICKWNTVSPTTKNLVKVAAALKVKVDKLLRDE